MISLVIKLLIKSQVFLKSLKKTQNNDANHESETPKERYISSEKKATDY